MDVEPGTIVAGFVAVFVALLVGPALASAKREASFPLLSSCVPVLGGLLNDTFLVAPFIECAVGGMIFFAIPGIIGIGLLTFRNAR